MSEKLPCSDNCPKLRPFKKSGIESDNLTPVKYRHQDRDGLPIDYREYWELASIVSERHTFALAKTQEEAQAFKDGINVCPGPKEIKVFGITVFRRCQNPNKDKGKPDRPNLRAV